MFFIYFNRLIFIFMEYIWKMILLTDFMFFAGSFRRILREYRNQIKFLI